jgi:ABC-2 type transport system ATP-binding protein
MTELAIECVGLTYAFGDHVAVDDLDLTVEQGSIAGLLGPNGAGKTTTIRVLNTLLPLQSGTARVLGLDVDRQKMAVRRRLGYVPQQLSIEGTLTGRENVTLFARLFDIPRKQRRARVDEVLEAMDLTESAERLASSFSGGMVRRLELAQALVNRPRLLILDEPTVGLDPVARDGVWDRVRAMRDEHGTTVLLTTHYMEEADALCDSITMLHRGTLRAHGSPAELKKAVGPHASLDDVFRHFTGDSLEIPGGGLTSVRSTRRTARRVG